MSRGLSEMPLSEAKGRHHFQTCEIHANTPVQRKDILTKTYLGCWRCKLDTVWKASIGGEIGALEDVGKTLAYIKGKEDRQDAITALLKEFIKKQEASKELEIKLRQGVDELNAERSELQGKCQRLTKQVTQQNETLQKNQADNVEVEARAGRLHGQVSQLEREREVVREESLAYVKHIAALEAKLQLLIEEQKPAVQLPLSPARTEPASEPRLTDSHSPIANKQRNVDSPYDEQHNYDAEEIKNADTDTSGGSGRRDSRRSLANLFSGFSKKKLSSITDPPESPIKEPAVSNTRLGDTAVSTTKLPRTPIAPAAGVETLRATTGTTTTSGKQQRPKLCVIAHMGGQDRVNFKMYRDQEFRQVMERYLKVKRIDAPVDEVRFVVDGVKHVLAPELTPNDFKLTDGATIAVIVPQEYLDQADS